MQGCGVTHAVLLTRAADQDRAKAEMERRPGHFVRSVATDPAQPDADKVLRDAIKGGAVSIGEMKFHVALDSPEMRRVYDIAAEMQVPVMMHIQTFPHFEGETPYNTGYPQFDKVLRAYPRTNFIGHGDLFWAHISADVPTDRGYPAGPIKAGGLTGQAALRFPESLCRHVGEFRKQRVVARHRIRATSPAPQGQADLRQRLQLCGRQGVRCFAGQQSGSRGSRASAWPARRSGC